MKRPRWGARKYIQSLRLRSSKEAVLEGRHGGGVSRSLMEEGGLFVVELDLLLGSGTISDWQSNGSKAIEAIGEEEAIMLC